MPDAKTAAPEGTTVRVALWRALHVQVDPPPHVLADELGQRRRPETAARLRVFEVDQPGPQAWKRQRLIELGFGIPEWLRLVPVDFEAGASWWERLTAAGLDARRPAVVASAGVAMYRPASGEAFLVASSSCR